MSNVAVLHACAVSFWFGVVGVEFVIERSRAKSRVHGYAVAKNHFWIDVLLEIPVALIVLTTGLILLKDAALTPLLMAKIAAGLLAVGVNLLCLIPVILRHHAADAEQLPEVVLYSRMIDQITAVGLPAGVLALFIGLFQ